MAPSAERYGAPTVAVPRDVSTVFAAPCQLLFNAQELRQLKIVEQGRPRSYMGSNQCSWTTLDDDILSVAVDDKRDLLVDTYRSRLTPIFVETRIEGLPAVRQRNSDQFNSCTVTTGLGPMQALEADFDGLAPASPLFDPCARAEEAIALAVRKLPRQR